MLETILFLKINCSVEEEKASNNRPRNGNEFEDTWSWGFKTNCRYLYHFGLSVMVMLVIYWHCSEICVKWVQQELFLYITTIIILFWFCLILFSSVLDWKFFNQSHNKHNRCARFNLNPVSFSCFALDFRHFPIYLVRYTFCVHCCWVANTSFSSFSNLVLLVLVLFLLV